MTKTRQKLHKKIREIVWVRLMLVAIWQVSEMQCMQSQETEIMQICWNRFWKNLWKHIRLTYFWRVLFIWNLCAAAEAMVSVLSDPMLEEASNSLAMAVAIFLETLFEIRHEGPNWICDKFYYIPDMYYYYVWLGYYGREFSG